MKARFLQSFKSEDSSPRASKREQPRTNSFSSTATFQQVVSAARKDQPPPSDLLNNQVMLQNAPHVINRI
jgi:hypothetical protein